MRDYTGMHIGFTGSSRQTTAQQERTFGLYLNWCVPAGWVHLGDCVKADAFAHKELRNQWPTTKLVGHIPLKPGMRAFCQYDLEYPPEDYLARNRTIVDASQRLWAMPMQMAMEARGGTWSTVRYARKTGKQVTIFWPDGSLEMDYRG